MSTPPPPQNSSWNLLCHYSWKCTMCSLQALPEKAWRIRSFFFIWHRIKKPSTRRIKRSMGLCGHLWPGQGKFWAWPCVFLFDLSAERILRPLYAQCGKQLLQGTTLPASSYWSSCTQLFCWEVIIKFTIENRRTCITLFFLFFLFLSHFNL